MDWPRTLVYIYHKNKKWLSASGFNFSDFHSKYLGFESALWGIRDDVYTDLFSSERIGLPFSVQTHIVSINHIGFKDDSSKIVHVDVCTMDEEYETLKRLDEGHILN